MKCVIHGSGGVGGYYGGCLARAGHEVFFIARGAHLEAIQQQGLSIKSAKGDFRIETPKSGERCDPNFYPDLVIVAVKSWQLPEITEEIKNYCTPSTLILPLQNGANASDILADTLGPERVLGGLTKISQDRSSRSHQPFYRSHIHRFWRILPGSSISKCTGFTQ